jgi:hypothetical protein
MCVKGLVKVRCRKDAFAAQNASRPDEQHTSSHVARQSIQRNGTSLNHSVVSNTLSKAVWRARAGGRRIAQQDWRPESEEEHLSPLALRMQIEVGRRLSGMQPHKGRFVMTSMDGSSSRRSHIAGERFIYIVGGIGVGSHREDMWPHTIADLSNGRVCGGLFFSRIPANLAYQSAMPNLNVV